LRSAGKKIPTRKRRVYVSGGKNKDRETSEKVLQRSIFVRGWKKKNAETRGGPGPGGKGPDSGKGAQHTHSSNVGKRRKMCIKTLKGRRTPNKTFARNFNSRHTRTVRAQGRQGKDRTSRGGSKGGPAKKKKISRRCATG